MAPHSFCGAFLLRRFGSQTTIARRTRPFHFASYAFICAVFVSLWPATLCGRQDEASPSEPVTHIATDETGRHIAVPLRVRRIVSLAPNLTETVYALGLQDHLVGDTIYCDYPPEARSKPHVGATLNPSLEAILALNPDLVLATTTINREE